MEHQRNRSGGRDLAAEPHRRRAAGEVTCNRPASPKTVTHVLFRTSLCGPREVPNSRKGQIRRRSARDEGLDLRRERDASGPGWSSSLVKSIDQVRVASPLASFGHVRSAEGQSCWHSVLRSSSSADSVISSGYEIVEEIARLMVSRALFLVRIHIGGPERDDCGRPCVERDPWRRSGSRLAGVQADANRVQGLVRAARPSRRVRSPTQMYDVGSGGDPAIVARPAPALAAVKQAKSTG